jgi:tRNA A-37 threonylcarbamoyl transferase component Bud32
VFTNSSSDEKWSRENSKKIDYKLNKKIDYDARDYISRLVKSYPSLNIIEWEKVTLLNGMEEKSRNKFIKKNIFKIYWDISKALFGIHSRGIIHGDPVLDNIGINQKGNFMLYDFDGTKFSNEIVLDYNKFNTSIENIVGKKHPIVPVMKDVIIHLVLKENITHQKAFNKLERMKILY